jgi:hypothetical protein
MFSDLGLFGDNILLPHFLNEIKLHLHKHQFKTVSEILQMSSKLFSVYNSSQLATRTRNRVFLYTLI